MSKTPSSSHSLQKSEPAAIDLRQVQDQLNDLRDMADLVPVLASVQQHLEEEKENHRKRMTGLLLAFACLFSFFLIAPVYLGHSLLKQNQAATLRQQDLQIELVETLEEAMNRMGRTSSVETDVEAYQLYQEALNLEKEKMREVLETLMDEVDAALRLQSSP